jgi:hypothetical protein
MKELEEPFEKEKTRDIKETLLSFLTFAPGDWVYDVKERELKGWDGPRVTEYARIIKEIEQFVGITEKRAYDDYQKSLPPDEGG